MDIKFFDFKSFCGPLGNLTVVESNQYIPFDIKRVYFIHGVRGEGRRGFHAHKNLVQVAFCVTGMCKFLLDDGKEKKTVILDDMNKGLLIDKLIWHEMYDFSEDCVLTVIADNHYNESDYIRDYDEFLEELEK